MYFNQLKHLIRVFRRDAFFTSLNLLGLTLGISVGIILFLYLQSELNYDSHHRNGKNIYRFVQYLHAPGVEIRQASNSREIGPALREEIPDVLNYLRFQLMGRTLVTIEKAPGQRTHFYEEKIAIADSSFFSFFTHDVIEGNQRTCLMGKGKVVLTRSIADKYFGGQPALGQTLNIEGAGQRVVSAVISDLPHNSHYRYEILLSFIEPHNKESEVNKSQRFWSDNEDCFTYVLMSDNYDPGSFADQFKPVFEKYYQAFGRVIPGEAVAEPTLQPLESIHFSAGLSGDEPVGDKVFMVSFTAIGLLVILLACINYMNLTTARSMVRSKEIVIKKILGDSRFKLFQELMIESLFLSFVASLLALVFSYVILEWTPFNAWIDQNLSLDFVHNPALPLACLGITGAIGVLSGVYPALYIPTIPTAILVGSHTLNKTGGSFLRKTLITFQLIISIVTIVTTLIMAAQMEYIKDYDVGIEPEQIVFIEVSDSTVRKKIDVIKAELKKDPRVISASASWEVPIGQHGDGTVFMIERDGEMVQQIINNLVVDHDYLTTLGLELIQGRNFDRNLITDQQQSFIINETAAASFGWGDDPLDRRIGWFHSETPGRVIGVVKDFNFESLYNRVGPMVICLAREPGWALNIRIHGTQLDGALAHIEEVMTSFDPLHPFENYFMDQEFATQYKSDDLRQQLISLLSFICFFISVLGLVGLTAFVAGQRAKEVCIRKVLGASVGSVVALFTKSYSGPMLLAVVVAIPVSNYLAKIWIAKFAYQVTLDWYLYLLPALSVCIVGLIVIALQTIRPAMLNPVYGLRTE